MFCNIFDRFKGGPDWVNEHQLAEERLDKWREEVLDEYQKYEAKLAKHRALVTRDAKRTLKKVRIIYNLSKQSTLHSWLSPK